jgi:hypothetical protein
MRHTKISQWKAPRSTLVTFVRELVRHAVIMLQTVYPVLIISSGTTSITLAMRSSVGTSLSWLYASY